MKKKLFLFLGVLGFYIFTMFEGFKFIFLATDFEIEHSPLGNVVRIYRRLICENDIKIGLSHFETLRLNNLT
jgi:hypothetical protein